MKKRYFPIYVDISQKPVLVVGGGNVARRKLMYLLDFGADVVCIAPRVLPEISQLADEGKIRLIKREYRENDAENYDFVFAATNNSEADKLIFEDCKKHGALLNVADVPAFCSFILSSYVKKGDITINISSGGTAPFFVKHLKNTIADCLPEHFEEIAELAGIFRAKLVKDPRYKDEKLRNELIKKFLDIDCNEIIEEQGFESALTRTENLL